MNKYIPILLRVGVELVLTLWFNVVPVEGSKDPALIPTPAAMISSFIWPQDSFLNQLFNE